MTTRRLSRSALLRSTALQAVAGLALVGPAVAQPAPNARPIGGQVTAGSASIATTPAITTITQSTNRAAINWTSYNVGSQQTVNYQQPTSTSVTLNRVTSSDPSQIAGKINANGQIVITNQSGVTFYQGSEVNAQSVVVSAAGITNQNFMAGKMAFDQAANPNARIVNSGTITVKQAGLAALVAPSVANSGVINAKLGQVILAGAAAHTLDMYGDGLVSIDVTKQVTTVPSGPDGKAVAALVTNTGTIRADGGVVQLTASAADGVVQTLVRAGGHIQANTVGNQTGRIEVAGTGGSVVVEGRLAADGRALGTTGGQVMVAGSTTTTIAAGARVTANGRSGGGTVAIGTTLARATGSGVAPAGTSARTVIASGARVSANATGQGNGGRITVLSTQQTAVNGALAAKGGAASGNGGEIEMSGELGFSLTGTADTSAPHGALGTVLLDPQNLTISSTSPSTITPSPTLPNIAYDSGGTTTDAVVSPAQLTALSGQLVLQASQNLTVASSLNYTQGSVTLQAGNNLTVNNGVTLSAGGNLLLYAGWSGIPGYNPAGTLSVLGAISGQAIDLRAGTGGIALSGTLTATTVLELTTSGAVTQTGGSVQTPNIFGTVGSVSLVATGNQISGLGTPAGVIGTNTALTTTTGGLAVATAVPLTVGANSAGITGGAAVPTGHSVSLQADTMSLIAGSGQSAISAPGGTVILQPLTPGYGIIVTGSSSVPGGQLALTPTELNLIGTGTLQLGGAATTGGIVFGQFGETIDLASGGTIGGVALSTTADVTQGGPLLVKALSGSAGNITLDYNGNSIPSVTGLTAPGNLTLSTTNGLTLSGTTSAIGSFAVSAGGNLSVLSTGSVGAPYGGTLTAGGTLSIAGPVSSSRSFALNAETGGIALAANVGAGNRLTITSAGPVTQTAGGITTVDLEGSAQSVSLPSRTNAIDLISLFGSFNVTGASGDFLLVDSQPLTVASPSSPGGIFVQTGRTISLSTDSLTLQANQYSATPYALSAPGGTIVIAPFTSGYGVLLTSSTKPAGMLALTTTELAQTTAATLQLGLLDSTNTPTAGAVTLGQAGETIDLGANGGFTTLNLVASGGVTQGGPLAITTITGQGGSLSLPYGNGESSNYISNLAGFTTTAGDISLHTSAGLTVSGTVVAMNGANPGNVTLSATGDTGQTDGGRPVGILLTGTLSGNTVALDSTNGGPLSTSGGISQTGGTITATTLTASGLFANFPLPNAIADVGTSTTYNELTISTASLLNVSGTVTSQTSAVILSAAGITQSAPISAVEFDGSSSADTVLTNPTNTIDAIGYFTQFAGNFTLATASSRLNFGGNTGLVTATSGSLTFLADSVGLVPSPVGGISAPQGAITFAPFTASRRIEVIGNTAADPNSLSLSQTFLDRITAMQVLAIGNGASTGPINIANVGESVTIPDNASLQLQTTGVVTEGVSPGGQNGGGTLSLVAADIMGSTGTLSLGAAANQILVVGGGSTVPGTLSGLASTGSITIATSTTLSVENAISANATGGTLSLTAGGGLSATSGPISASAINLTAGSGNLTLSGSLTTSGTLNTVSLTATTGSVTQSSGALTTGSLTVAGTAVTLGTPTNSIGNLASASVTGALTLSDGGPLSVGGAVTAGTFDVTDSGGGLAINATVAVTGLNVALQGALTEGSGGLLQASSLAGNASLVSLGNSNLVSSVGDFTANGGFTLANGGTYAANALSLTGTLAGGGVSIQNYGPVTLSGVLTASSVAITAFSTQTGSQGAPFLSNGTITQTGGSITAGLITLTNGDAFSQTGGSLTGTGTTGQITISTQGALTLDGVISAPLVTLSALTRSYPINFDQQTQINPGIISQTGGSITGVVSGHSDTTTALAAPGDAITGLAGFTSTGGFLLSTSRLLAVTGTVSDPTSIALSAAGGIALGASITGGAVTLTAPGSAITQTAGVLTASSLTGSAGSVALGATGNEVTALQAFTSTGGFSLADAAPLSIAGAVSVGTGQTLTITDNAPSFATGGSLSAPGGTVALREYTAGGGVTLGGGSGLSGTAPITATTLSIGVPTGGPISIAGAFNLSAVSVLDLESGGAISETGAGAIGVPKLTGHAASAALGGANQITTLGSFTSTGAFALTDATGLTVTGPLSATAAALNVTGALTLSGPVTATTSLSLAASGAITQPAGAIITPILLGSAASATLGSATNSIVTLAGFATTGDFALVDGRGLTVSAPVDPNTITLTIAGDLALTSSLTATNVILTVTGALTEGTGGLISATTLSGSAGSASLGNSNAIATLGSFATSTGLTLVDGRPLTVSGPVTDGASVALSSTGLLTLAGNVTAPIVTLTSVTGPSLPGGITQTAGTITGTTSVSLTSPGTISQTGGTIAAGSLTGSSTGTTTLGSAGNAVTSLASFSSAGGFSLVDGSPLTVTGPVTDGTSVTLSTTGAMTLAGTVQTGALSLNAADAITQPGGSLTASSLTGSGAGITLGATGNSVTTLGSFTSTSAFALTDATGLTVTGPLSAAAAALNVTGALTLSGPVTATTSLSLAASGAITQPTGAITTASLSGSGASATFGSATNSIVTLAGFATTGAFALTDGRGLAVSGPVSASQVSLAVTGALTEGTGGLISATTLSGSAASASLGNSNAIATLGSFATSTGLTLVDGRPLTVSGPVTDGASVALSSTGLLTLAGNVTAPIVALTSVTGPSLPGGITQTAGTITGTTSVSLTSPGTISQTGGTIAASSLTGSSTGTTTLGSASNAVTSLASFSSAGGFSLVDGSPLTVTGPVTDATSVTLSTTGALALAGTVQTGALSLTSVGAITQPGGSLTASSLTGSGAGITLGATGNSVTTLGSFTSTGAFALTDATGLTVTGPLSATAAALNVTGALTLSGPVTATTSLSLAASGAITQPTGAITTASLSGSGASATFGSATNSIVTLAGFATTGAFALTDGRGLAVSGPVSASQVSLTVTGALTEGAGGLISATTLSGSAGSASLGNSNAIATLGSFATSTGLTLVDGRPLTVSGPVTDGASVALSSTGLLTLAGNVTAPIVALTSVTGPSLPGGITQTAGTITGTTSVSLTSPGTISQTGGTIAAGSLTGSSLGTTTLGSAGNAVISLASFSSAGGFSLVDGSPLTVTGPVTDGTSVTLSTTGAMTLAGTVQTSALSLTSVGAITQPGGSLTASSLTGSGAGITLGATGNSVTALGSFTSAGAFALTDGRGLAVSGPVSASQVSLAVTGALTEGTGGLISATTLSGSAGSASLGNSNAIATLGSFATSTGLTLVDGRPLTVSGPVTDGASVALSSTGLLTLAGNVTAPIVALTSVTGPSLPGGITQTAGTITGTTSVSLTSPGTISQTGGTIAAGSLTGSSLGTTTLGSAGNAVTSLASFSSAGGFSLVDGSPLTVTGPVTDGTSVTLSTTGAMTLAGTVQTGALSLNAAGAITQPGGSLTASSLTGSGAGITLGATGNSVTTLGSFTSTSAFALTDATGLTVTGPLSATAAALNVTGALTLSGPVTATTSLSLAASGAITQPTGAITTPILLGSATSATLGSATNSIITLAGFATTGDFALADGRGLTVSAPVDPNTITLTIAGDLALTSSLTATNVILTVTGALTEGAGGLISATTLSGSAGSASLGNSNAIATLGSFATTTGLTLVDGRPLTVSGPVTDGASVALSSTGLLTLAGNVSAPIVTLTSVSGPSLPGGITQTAGTITGTTSVSLTSPGTISQTGGTIAAGSLTGSSTGTTTLGSASNAVTSLASFSSAGGFSLVDGSPLTVTGPVTDGTSVTLSTTGAMTLAGTVQTSALSLNAAGAITQPGGSLTASSLGVTGASVTLQATGNSIATLASVSTSGDFSLTDSVPLTVAGAVSADAGQTLTITDNAPMFASCDCGSLPASGGTVVLREYTAGGGITLAGDSGVNGPASITAARVLVGVPTGGPITITGAFNLSNATTLDLESASTISETGAGSIRTNVLTGAGTSVTLTGANQLGSLGAFRANTLALSVSGNLALTGAIVAPNGVSLLASGAITQPSGSITTSSLTGSAASAALTSTGNQIGTLAGFSTTGDFSLADGQSLIVAAPVDPNTVTLTVLGTLTLNSSVTAGTVVLNATGGIVETGSGQVVATTLTGTGNSASLTGPNQVATLGNFRTNAGFALTTTQPLTVTGTVTDGQSIGLTTTGALNVTGSLTVPGTTAAPGVLTLDASGPITLAGTVNAGTLAVTSPGSLTQTGGTVSVTSLVGTVLGPLTLGTAGKANVGSVGNLTSSTAITLVDGGPLQLTGTVAAPNLAITATGQLTLAGGVIETNGLPATQQLGAAPSLPGSYLQVLPGASGAATLRQSGTTTIAAFSGASSAVRFDLPATGGTLTFNALNAPATDVVLSLGNAIASGSLTARSLTVLGAGGSASFTGQIGDYTGFDAAELSRITPLVSASYTLNNCAIGAASCSGGDSLLSSLVASLQASSVIRPDILTLDVLDLSVTRDRDDPTLLLPNISDRDY